MRHWVHAVKGATVLIIGAALGGCPLPFQYSRAGWSGNASAADPSTPDVSGQPRAVYSQSSGGGGTLQSGQSGTTSSNTTIQLETDTTGAVIYYTTNGTTPDPRSSQTSRYDPSFPLQLSIASPSTGDSSASLTLNATAIGPNMKPSPVMSNVTVAVQYPQAAAPVFAPAGGAYTSDQNVAITCATPGATIYYTMVTGPGPAPAPSPGQAGTVQYTAPIALTGPAGSWTISAVATVSQMLTSTTTSASYSVTYPGLPNPTFNPPAGTYSNNQTVSITSGAGATIWYTTDGSSPVPGTSSSIPSGGTASLSGGASGTGAITITAVATEQAFANSPTVSAAYSFVAAAPVADVSSGTYNNDMSVQLSTATNGATIYYTTDGSTPSTSSSVFAGVIPVTTSMTLKTIASLANYQTSSVATYVYTMQAATPTFSAGGGTYSTALSVTITEATSGASVYYTTDGSVPTTASPLYTGGAISMPNGLSTTLKAIAVKSGYVTSIVDSVTYVVLIPPTGLTVGAATGSTIPVSWSAPPGTSLTGYVVKRGTEPTCTVSPYYLYPAGTSFTDSGLPSSTGYYYVVSATYTAGSSAFSSSIQGYTLSSTGDPAVVTENISSFPPPSTYVATYFTDSIPSGSTPVGPVLRDGGYTYVAYGQDFNNDITTVIGVFNSANQLVAQYTVNNIRYIYNMTEAAGIVTLYGQGPTIVTVPWATIPP